MTKIVEKLLTAASMIILLMLVSIFALPAFLIAASAKSDVVGKAQRIQDPQKLQKVIYALVQKAHAQHKIINEWHRKARLETNKAQANNRKQSTKAMAAAAAKRACQIQLAMARTPEDITIPGCRPKSRTN